jgi:hypothetical protein
MISTFIKYFQLLHWQNFIIIFSSSPSCLTTDVAKAFPHRRGAAEHGQNGAYLQWISNIPGSDYNLTGNLCW